jgi:hypothetical protein
MFFDTAVGPAIVECLVVGRVGRSVLLANNTAPTMRGLGRRGDVFAEAPRPSSLVLSATATRCSRLETERTLPHPVDRVVIVPDAVTPSAILR